MCVHDLPCRSDPPTGQPSPDADYSAPLSSQEASPHGLLPIPANYNSRSLNPLPKKTLHVPTTPDKNTDQCLTGGKK